MGLKSTFAEDYNTNKTIILAHENKMLNNLFKALPKKFSHTCKFSIFIYKEISSKIRHFS